MPTAFSTDIASLSRTDPANWPAELSSSRHLILSSPATLAFNSPGAEGFGVKRAALTLPNSCMLLFSPGCCGRNTSAVGGIESDYGQRMFYLLLDETDIVTGRYLKKIVRASEELMAAQKKRPEVLVLCSTCVDALLGTDMDRLVREVKAKTGTEVIAATMYALTREGHLPPMVLVRKSIYSLLRKAPKRADQANILGFFTHLACDCELYPLLHSAGITTIHELARKRSMAEFQEMAQANFNLVLHPEARYAAQFLADELEIPFIELTRSFELKKIHGQYNALAKILHCSLDDSPYLEKAEEELSRLSPLLAEQSFAIGETSNAEPYGLALALLRMGARVREIFADPSVAHLPYLKAIAALSPDTRIYSNLSPSMLFYKPDPEVTCAIGFDACHYHQNCPGFAFTEDAQPFGYQGLLFLLQKISHCLTQKKSTSSPKNISSFSGNVSSHAPLSSTKVKGLLTSFTPFAPDQSGVVSALYELGGLIVVCDAGGCTGNLCGFDEPRWTKKDCALFSAGLRDMDAILGRDQRLIDKTQKACETISPSFVAIVGTPVPCVIATDFRGLERLGEKACHVPVLTFPTTGTRYYDQGLSMAYHALMDRFAIHSLPVRPDSVGVIGASPLDLGEITSLALSRALKNNGAKEVVVHGLDFGLDAIKSASELAKNIVLSPSGFAAAKLLQERFGTPYDFDFPMISQALIEKVLLCRPSSILIIHQQVAAHSLRKTLRLSQAAEKIVCASFFMQLPELSEKDDQALCSEEDLRAILTHTAYDCVIGDIFLKRALPDTLSSSLTWIDFPHFAVSGRLNTSAH